MLTTDLNATYDDYVPYTGDSGRLNEDVSNKQDKADNALTTTAKTVVGAINELDSDLTNNTSNISALFSHLAQNSQKLYTDVLSIDLINPFGTSNESGYVEKNLTSNLPADCELATREILWISSSQVFVRLTGFTTSNTLKTWLNFYNNGAWVGWY
jgi:hypothetical protein